MIFPITRMRRYRKNQSIRDLFRKTRVFPEDLIYPLFLVEGSNVDNPIKSMPGISQLSIDKALEEIDNLTALGLKSVILFGIPHIKDEMGSGAYDDNGIVQKGIKAIKSAFPDLIVVTDVCMCEYTSHGHCGIIENKEVANDPTLSYLAKTAVSHARAGADIVAPSDMMDGRIGVIREALDDSGFQDVILMSYSAKYASAFYGPFRDAAESAPQFGDRQSYQMDPASSFKEALREGELDMEEGADILMVKPAMAYMDIIKIFEENFDCPICCYNVSGEYSMVKAAAEKGWIDEKKTVMELMLGFKRAGADLIITYHTKDILKWMKD
jgi:porphobilinogen synthase